MVVGSAGAVVYLSKELDAVVCLSELTVWEELEDCVRLSFGGSFLATLLWRFRLCGIVLFVCAFGLSVRQSVCLVLFRSVPFVFLEFLNLCFAQGGAPRPWKKKVCVRHVVLSCEVENIFCEQRSYSDARSHV